MENMPKQQQSFTTTCTLFTTRQKESDLILFLDGMTVLGVPKWKRTLMYLAVEMFWMEIL